MTSRALVLGGGGITGIAWEIGLLAGLAEAGVDLLGADLVIGTSAGSVVGAQISSGTGIEALYERQLAPPSSERPAKLGPRELARLGWALLGARDPQRARARVGAMALRSRTMPEQRRREVIGSRLPSPEWPQRSLLITAIDAETGEFEVFDRDSAVGEHPVSLLDAVAASCAVPGVYPPATIGSRRFIDGGLRSLANADLAAGHDRVVVLAPVTRGAGPLTPIPVQVEALRARSRVVVASPDAAARGAIGRNVLDPARRAASARAGRAQAAAVAREIAEVWTG